MLQRSIDKTATGLGADGAGVAPALRAPRRRFDDLGADILRPVAHLPRHPLLLAASAPGAGAGVVDRPPLAEDERGPCSPAWPRTPSGRSPVRRPRPSVWRWARPPTGTAGRWPRAGPSASPTRSPPSCGPAAGASRRAAGHVLAEVDGRRGAARPRHRRGAAARRRPAPGRVARAYRRYRHGPAAFKVDLAVEGGVPWIERALPPRRARCTSAGPLEQVAAAEADIAAGRMPERPFVLVGQQYLADPTRSPGTSTPSGSTRMSRPVTPATRPRPCCASWNASRPASASRIVGRPSARRRTYEAYNPNFVGGDISTGANDPYSCCCGPGWPSTLSHRHPRRVHLLGRDPARRRRPRHVRSERRGVGAEAPAPLTDGQSAS